MNKLAITNSLKSCLGKKLISATFSLHELEGVEPTQFDFAEIILDFDAPETMRYFSWKQIEYEFVLSAQNSSHLIAESFAEISGEQNVTVSKSLGKRHTVFELYGDDELENAFAALLRFEDESFVIAVGYDDWNETTQTANFRFFSGDTLFLWTEAEFVETLEKEKHPLKLLARLETNVL